MRSGNQHSRSKHHAAPKRASIAFRVGFLAGRKKSCLKKTGVICALTSAPHFEYGNSFLNHFGDGWKTSYHSMLLLLCSFALHLTSALQGLLDMKSSLPIEVMSAVLESAARQRTDLKELSRA